MGDCVINGKDINNLRTHNIDFRYNKDQIELEILNFICDYSIDNIDRNSIIEYILGLKNNYIRILSFFEKYEVPLTKRSILLKELEYIKKNK